MSEKAIAKVGYLTCLKIVTQVEVPAKMFLETICTRDFFKMLSSDIHYLNYTKGSKEGPQKYSCVGLRFIAGQIMMQVC